MEFLLGVNCLGFMVATLLQTSSAATILLMPFPWKSHVVEFTAIGSTLVQRGHNVHILLPSHYPDISKFSTNESDFKLLDYVGKHPDFLTFSEDEEHDMFEKLVAMTPIMDFRENTKGFTEVCYNVLDNQDLEVKIRAAKFDMVITDGLPNTRCYYVLLYRIGLPYISVTTHYEPWLFRAPALPSFVPFPLLQPPLTPKMSFWERVVNMWTLVDWTATTHKVEYLSDSFVMEYAPKRSAVSLNYLAAQSLLWLFDTDIAIDYPRPMMANEVNIGGLSTKPAQPLPTDLQEFMDSAPDGVILLSFGSHSTIPERYMLMMLEALKKISKKVNVIFRYPFQQPTAIPNNIKLIKWAPQNDILGHANIKLFVTHCGANSQFEALYHGVPMLNFPVFGDQPYNAKRAEYHGFAETLDVGSFTAKQFQAVIQKMLKEGSYSRKIKKASKIFRSKPMHPREQASHSIEHILEFGGSHLRSAAVDLAWYEYVMLDVFLFLLVLLVAALWIIINTILLCVRRCKQVYGELNNAHEKKRLKQNNNNNNNKVKRQ